MPCPDAISSSRFPFLFYSSTFVGEIYYRYEHPPPEPGSEDSHDALGNVGRLGSMSLVIFSLVTLISSILLPYLVRPQAGEDKTYTPRPPPSLSQTIQAFLVRISNLQPDLIMAWLMSNLLFAAITSSAPWVHSLGAATTLVALCGIPWAVSSWAPFGLLGIEINKLSSGPHATVRGSVAPGYTPVRGSVDEDGQDDIEMDRNLDQHSPSLVSDEVLQLYHPDDHEAHSSTGELAGIYLGVLNVYTTLPQFVGTFVSWIVFSILEPDRNDSRADDEADHHRWLNLQKNAPNAIAVCLFIGAMCSLVAAESARRLKKMS